MATIDLETSYYEEKPENNQGSLVEEPLARRNTILSYFTSENSSSEVYEAEATNPFGQTQSLNEASLETGYFSDPSINGENGEEQPIYQETSTDMLVIFDETIPQISSDNIGEMGAFLATTIESLQPEAATIDQLQEKNPALAEKIFKFKEKLAEVEEKNFNSTYDSILESVGINKSSLDKMDLDPTSYKNITNKRNEIIASAVDKAGQQQDIKISLKSQMLLMLALLLCEKVVGKYELSMIVENVNQLGKFALASMGIEAPDSMLQGNYGEVESIFETYDTETVLTILNRLDEKKLVKFLSEMDKGDRRRMFSGDNFGSLFNKHQLNQEQISALKSKIPTSQQSALGI